MSSWPSATPSPPPLPSSVSPTPGNPPLYAPQPQRTFPIPGPGANDAPGMGAAGAGGYGQQGVAGQYAGQAGAYGQQGGGFYQGGGGQFAPGQQGGQPGQPGFQQQGAAGFFPTQLVQELGGGPAAQLGMEFASKYFSERSDFVNQNVQNYINVNRFKYYFTVSNKYVIDKLTLLMMPWRHRSWSRLVRRSPQGQVEGYRPPREDINAPDLYIPAMAFVTYVLLVGVALGQQDKFHPAQLGSTSSTALALLAVEILLFRLGVYLLNITMEGSMWDVVAVGGYKFVGIIMTMLVKLTPVGGSWSVVASVFVYFMIAWGIVLLRTLKYAVLPEQFRTDSVYAPASTASTAHLSGAAKQRRVYFLVLMAGIGMLVSGALVVIA